MDGGQISTIPYPEGIFLVNAHTAGGVLEQSTSCHYGFMALVGSKKWLCQGSVRIPHVNVEIKTPADHVMALRRLVVDSFDPLVRSKGVLCYLESI